MKKHRWIVVLLLVFAAVLQTSSTGYAQRGTGNDPRTHRYYYGENNKCAFYTPEEVGSAYGNIYARNRYRPSVSYVPPWVSGGDRDFHGNGPYVEVDEIVLSVTETTIKVEVGIDARETKKDWTRAKGKAELLVFEVSPEYYIDQLAYVFRYEGDLGPDGYYPATSIFASGIERFFEFSYTDNDHEIDRFSWNKDIDTVMRLVEIVGDTKGSEAGSRTKITVNFNIPLFGLCKR